MSEFEQILCQFFVRSISGAVALVVGTGLCYFLFIGGYLRRLEHYKERLKVYKYLDKRIAKILRKMGVLKRRPEWVDAFSNEMERFNKYVNGEDRLFMSVTLRTQCQRVTRIQEEMMPHEYPEPPEMLKYPEEKLLNLEMEFRSLRSLIEDEIEASRFGFSPEVAKWWFRSRRRLSG